MIIRAASDVTFVEVSVGELMDAFQKFDVRPLDPDREVPYAFAQRATVRLLELLGADQPQAMVMPWTVTG
jgi:hypothetical protein